MKNTDALKGDVICFLFSITDERIPTVSLGVPNTESGHCSKTMAIIKDLADWMASVDPGPDWYVIADDDTILG